MNSSPCQDGGRVSSPAIAFTVRASTQAYHSLDKAMVGLRNSEPGGRTAGRRWTRSRYIRSGPGAAEADMPSVLGSARTSET